MHTIPIQVNNNDAPITLRTLENKQSTTSLEHSSLDSPSLPGEPLGLTEFKKWVKSAESAPNVSLSEAKEKWESRRQQLQNLGK